MLNEIRGFESSHAIERVVARAVALRNIVFVKLEWHTMNEPFHYYDGYRYMRQPTQNAAMNLDASLKHYS